jgi:hypothetical protein
MNWMLELGSGFLGGILMPHKATTHDSGSGSFEASAINRVREAVLATLQRREKTKDKDTRVNSFTVT